MRNITIDGNILVVDGKSIRLKYKITHYLEINDTIVVRLECRSRADDVDNLYGVIDGRIAWRIQNAKKYNPTYAYFVHDPYVGIDIYDKDPGLFVATSNRGFRFLVNPLNGKIVGTDGWVK